MKTFFETDVYIYIYIYIYISTTQVLLLAFNVNGHSLKLPHECGPTLLINILQILSSVT